MTNLRGRAVSLALLCAVTVGACGKSEPDIPTFDPMDKIQNFNGWKVERAIAVSPGKDAPKAHHIQRITSGLHDVDFKTPPKALIPVTPSCRVTRPELSSDKYLIIGDGRTYFPLMKNPDVPSIITFNTDSVNALAKEQADRLIEKGTRKNAFGKAITLPESSMMMKNIYITETSSSVVVALGGGGLYNFHLAPGARLKGVVVYTGETGYNKSMQAAVAGVPDDVPVNFVSQKHKATKGCWTRVQKRPDKSWAKKSQKGERFKAVKPHWDAFFKRVRKDIDRIPDKNVISVAYAGHYLIGPPPVNYEDRIPYVAFGGKTIHYSASDHVNFGTVEQNNAFARQILDQYYEAHVAANAK